MLCKLPGEFSQEHEGGKDTWDRAGVEGMRTASGWAACFVPEVSSAGKAGGEKPIKVTPWLGSTLRADVWLRRAAGRQVPAGLASRAPQRPARARVGAVSMRTGMSFGLLRDDGLHVSEFG